MRVGGGSGDYVQVAGQDCSGSAQKRDCGGACGQAGASNTNESVRVGSRGRDGDVSQSNSTTATRGAR